MSREQFWKTLAQLVTQSKGSDSLNRFAKLLVIGELKDRGFEDSRNENLSEVFNRPYVCCGYDFNVLVRFSFLSPNNRFIWDFASGNKVGKSVGESYISSKGRHSKWLGQGAEKRWEEHSISGVVLIGLDEKDIIRFYFLPKEKFFEMDTDRIIMKSGEGKEFEDLWKNLTFQNDFVSLMGGK